MVGDFEKALKRENANFEGRLIDEYLLTDLQKWVNYVVRLV